MQFTETKLPGAFVIDIRKFSDERGFFARSWGQRVFAEHGITALPVQANIAFNHKRGTVRGMHFQQAPHAETKLVRCVKGAIYDAIIDLRPESPTYTQWVGVELTADNYRMLFVPEGFAHGYQTLEDNTEVVYQVSQFYTPEAEGGVRHDDPAFDVVWPLDVVVLSQKDQAWANFTP